MPTAPPSARSMSWSASQRAPGWRASSSWRLGSRSPPPQCFSSHEPLIRTVSPVARAVLSVRLLLNLSGGVATMALANADMRSASSWTAAGSRPTPRHARKMASLDVSWSVNFTKSLTWPCHPMGAVDSASLSSGAALLAAEGGTLSASTFGRSLVATPTTPARAMSFARSLPIETSWAAAAARPGPSPTSACSKPGRTGALALLRRMLPTAPRTHWAAGNSISFSPRAEPASVVSARNRRP
mmetsp:Transcript_27239/g.78509  ORF Transcript_27239/g.78509 Transcript_27239/m.78509 type:complete len:242 (+) Transcript_27239:433-1158(+)